ncbi:MAG: nitroreductase family protein [Desulfuromonadales bacterium]|nr:nitroreductase family protein [Desulfuromonadales bacterium]
MIRILAWLLISLSFAAQVQAKGPELTKDTFAVIHSRKSVRSFTGAPISRENLEKIVRAGMAAPTAVNKQPWSFVVVTEKKTINTLAAGLPTARGIEKAGAVIIVCAEPEKAHMQSKDLAVVDASLASENILLATEALGLGGHWTASFPYEDKMKHVRAVLGIPANIIPLNVILVGVPTGEDKPKDKYQKDKIHWGKW